MERTEVPEVIKLTKDYGDRPVWVNPAFIVTVDQANGRTYIDLAVPATDDERDCVAVKETPEEVLTAIHNWEVRFADAPRGWRK
jgi:hypothetical protein